MSEIHYVLGQYGYFGIYGLLMLGIFGLPLPDETLLLFCGFLGFEGDFRLGEDHG
jgi:membrane protein DedA with SNARE-associated domain